MLERAEAIAEASEIEVEAAVRQARAELRLPDLGATTNATQPDAVMPAASATAAAASTEHATGLADAARSVDQPAAASATGAQLVTKKAGSGLRRGFLSARPAKTRPVGVAPTTKPDGQSAQRPVSAPEGPAAAAAFVGGVVERSDRQADAAPGKSVLPHQASDLSMIARTDKQLPHAGGEAPRMNEAAPQGSRDDATPAQRPVSRFKAQRARMYP